MQGSFYWICMRTRRRWCMYTSFWMSCFIWTRYLVTQSFPSHCIILCPSVFWFIYEDSRGGFVCPLPVFHSWDKRTRTDACMLKYMEKQHFLSIEMFNLFSTVSTQLETKELQMMGPPSFLSGICCLEDRSVIPGCEWDFAIWSFCCELILSWREIDFLIPKSQHWLLQEETFSGPTETKRQEE